MSLFLLYFGIPLGLLFLGYLVGKSVELLHIRSLEQRELEFLEMPVTNFRRVPSQWRVVDSFYVDGQAVIGSDYFKTAASRVRNFFGGRVRTLESVMQRARREALLRMEKAAREAGADAVWNVRMETSTVVNGGGDRQGLIAAEIHAYGTALRFAEGSGPGR